MVPKDPNRVATGLRGHAGRVPCPGSHARELGEAGGATRLFFSHRTSESPLSAMAPGPPALDERFSPHTAKPLIG